MSVVTAKKNAPFRRDSVLRIAALVVVVGAVATLVVTQWTGGTKTENAALAGRRFSWPEGTRYTYAVRWEGTSRRTVMGGNENGDLAGDAIFDGDVSVRSLGRGADGITTLVFALERVRDYDLRLGAGSLLTDRDRELAIAAMRKQEAIAHVDERGVVRSIAYHKATPASVREQLHHLIELMRVTLPADRARTWIAEEPNPNGVARVRYTDWEGTLSRVRVAYSGLANMVGAGELDQRVTSKATIRIDPPGIVRSIDDHEDLTAHGSLGTFASAWTFTASLQGTDKFDARAARLDDLDETSGAAELDRDRQRGRDERLSRDWTLSSIEIELLVAGRGQHIESTFVARAAAYVRLHPEACLHLVAWFEDARLTDLSRQLTMDVLSAAGSDEAQDAMRKALASRAVTLSPAARGALVQRFVFVTNPNAESARFVADAYDRSRAGDDPDVRDATAATLGAIVGHMQGNDALAAELDKRLLHALAERRSPGESAGLIRALGNAHTADDLPAITPFATHEHPAVREQVARALRRFTDDAATGALLSLAKDPIPAVVRAAYLGLREQALGDDEWEALARSVEAGETSSYADGYLVELLERRPDSGAWRVRMLRYVLARTPAASGNAEMRERIERMLPEKVVSAAE